MKRLQILTGILVLAALLSLYALIMYRPHPVIYERERPVYYATQYTEPSPVYIVDSRPSYWGFGGWGLPVWGGMSGYKKPFYHNPPNTGGPKGPGLPGMGGPPPPAPPPPAPAPPPPAPAPPPPAAAPGA